VSARAVFPGQTVDWARRLLTARFQSASIESAELDARLLTGAVLGLDLTALIVSGARQLTASEAERLHDFARRRLCGEPVARILGYKEFWGLSFKLSGATLVPRPDTETVVERALEIARTFESPIRIVDIGTGSGAILLALLSELPEAIGIGTDVSLAALRIAQGNARDLGLSPRASFVACNYAAALRGPFDLIVSNPPYIASSDIPNLVPDVRDHDPHQALDGGRDGLDAYRRLIPQAAELLPEGGALVVEAGLGQSRQIEALMTEADLKATGAPKADLGGVLRALSARKMPP
jgi:release factor glutamine methyltransferase